jgi:chemotaxis protein MotB
MVRKRRRSYQERENHDRWLVSYADFITLLFAFFVVMYSISSVSEGRYRVLSHALSNAFGFLHANQTPSPIAPIIASIGPPTFLKPRTVGDDERHKKEAKKIQDLADRLLKVLAPLVKEGQVRVTRGARGVAVEINASMLFAPAQAKLQPDAIVSLQALAGVLASIEEPVQIEGHTDDIPISTAQFPSNWELSSARASMVARFFIDNGVAGQRLVAAGYAENRPLDSNLTPEGRARNRRVTLMILTTQS